MSTSVKDKLISIIIPIFNDGPNIYPVISTLIFTLNRGFELIIVYDSDEDITLNTLRVFSKYKNIIVLRNEFGVGAINAVKTGINYAKYDYIMIWMSYHIDPYGKINDMLAMMDSGADLVSANRFITSLSHGRGNRLKNIISRYGNSIFNILTDGILCDITTSIKIFRTKKLKSIIGELSSDQGWSILVEWTFKFIINGYVVNQINFKENNLQFMYRKSNFKLIHQLKSYLTCIILGIKNRNKLKLPS